jgi:hypothetical protein
MENKKQNKEAKKVWSTPKLVVHGNVEEITKERFNYQGSPGHS